jgi:hypothetical protein
MCGRLRGLMSAPHCPPTRRAPPDIPAHLTPVCVHDTRRVRRFLLALMLVVAIVLVLFRAAVAPLVEKCTRAFCSGCVLVALVWCWC